MIAPVSRSFTLTTQHGGETAPTKRAGGQRAEPPATARRADR
jgi:hypothetical protein